MRFLPLVLLLAMTIPGWSQTSHSKHFAIRLKPGQDLKKELTSFLIQNQIKACAIVSCVGSLTEAELRFAGVSESQTVSGPLEIISLQGCGGNGKWHLHLSVSDSKGNMKGGHLMDGSRVRTTAEIVLIELEELDFQRVMDQTTGYPELEIQSDETKDD